MFNFELEEFREVVQPDHPEEVNLGKCSDDVEFCVLWQLRLQFKREKSSVSDVRPLAVTKQEHACSEPDALETTQQHKQGQDLSTIPEPVPRPNVHGRVWFLFSRRGKSLKLALTHKLRHQNRGLLKVQWKV